MKKNNNKKEKQPINLLLIITIIVLFIYPIYKIYQTIGREYEYIDNYYDIEEPIQIECNETATLKIDDKELDVKLLYEYEISGYVSATFTYLPYTLDNKVSPKDVTIVWGELLKEENLKKVKFIETGDRGVLFQAKDTEWYEEYGEIINEMFSHNHLIPSNKEIKKKIYKIKKGDYIYIKGYLVEVTYKDEYIRGTSTERTDTGDNSCESIYVTEIKWLKEKKD